MSHLNAVTVLIAGSPRGEFELKGGGESG